RAKPEEVGPLSTAAVTAASVTVDALTGARVSGALIGAAMDALTRGTERRRAARGHSRRRASTVAAEDQTSGQQPHGRRISRRSGRYKRLMGWTYRRDVMWTLLG